MGYVYAIGGNPGEPVKIGYSEHPQERLAALQTGNPVKLRLLAEVEAPQGLERRLHDQLAEAQLEGEWFRCDYAVECVVNTMMCPQGDDVGKIVALADICALIQSWEGVRSLLTWVRGVCKESDKQLAALLNSSCEVESLEGDVLTLGFYHVFHLERLRVGGHLDRLNELFSQALGRPVTTALVHSPRT